MFCPSCGESIEESDAFCRSCGKSLGSQTQPTQHKSQAAVAPASASTNRAQFGAIIFFVGFLVSLLSYFNDSQAAEVAGGFVLALGLILWVVAAFQRRTP